MMMYEMFWVCVEACAAATAGGFTVNGVTGNETVYLCPGMFDLGTSWWEIVLERDPEMRIETQAMCRSLTVVHEMMHLANRPWHGITNDRLPEFIGDVDIEHCDHPDMHYCKAYGREAAQELAKRDTTLALRNADNYAFYVADVFLAYLHGIASLDYKQEHELAENLPFVTIIPRTTEPETDISGKSSAGSNSDATSTDVDEPESTITATKGSSTDEPFGTATDMNAIVANATNTVNATDPITDIFDSILEWFGLNNSTHFNTSEGALEEEAEATSDDLETT
ncbi:hypothetical protein AC578_673 [Pseudocercospora eumusae]|nr:hypothetical protein AC578_673 [Pseudocercospora eumusae]